MTYQAEGSQCVWLREPSRKPLEIPDRPCGMKVSTFGVLDRAADRCRKARDWQTKGLASALEQLAKHIEELRNNPTPEQLGEFLSLWVE